MVRAKFCLVEVRKSSSNPTAQTLIFEPRYTKSSGEDKSYSRYTPSGRLEMLVDNPPVLERFELGKAYYLDFSEAPNNQHE